MMGDDRMKERMKNVLAALLVAALAFGGAFFGGRVGEAGQAQVMGDSHITSDVQMTSADFYANGNQVYLDSDDDSYIDGSTDDTLDVYLSGAKDFVFTANTFAAQSGSSFTGSFDASGGDLILENDETFSNANDGTITTTVASGGSFFVSTGNLAVGNGSPGDASMDGEDAYVEGESEFDGASYFDGAVDMDSTLDVADTATFSKGSGDAVIVSSGGDLDVDGTISLAGAMTLESGGTILASTSTTGTHGVVMSCFGSHSHSDVENTADICDIPANANIVDMMYVIATDWDDGSSATVNCGPSGSLTDYLSGVDINGVGDGTVHRVDGTNILHTGLGDVGASDITVQCQVAEGTGDASAGSATLYIDYQIDE
jgi:hypothetical protein